MKLIQHTCRWFAVQVALFHSSDEQHTTRRGSDLNICGVLGEGSKPIFARDEILQATHSPDKYDSKYEPKYEPHEHERIVTVYNRPALREGSRYTSPGRYETERFDGPSTSRDTRYNGNEDYRPSREYDRPTTSYNQRESSRTERQGGGDLRQQLEYRHDSSRYSVERGRPQERSGQDRRAGSSSDLRARLVEKRTDRHDDRPYAAERERHERRPSPPAPERRRPPAEFSERHESRGDYEGGGRRPRGDYEGSGSRRRHPSDSRPPREVESRRRRSRTPPSPDRYRGDADEEYPEHSREWDSNPEHVPRGGLYFEHDNREDDMPHMSERGRGRGMTRMRGSTYRGRGQRGGPMMRGGTGMRGIRPPFRGAPYPRGFPPTRAPRRGYPPRSGRKSSPKWEHDMFDTLSDQPAN